jgi:hypothetical protein
MHKSHSRFKRCVYICVPDCPFAPSAEFTVIAGLYSHTSSNLRALRRIMLIIIECRVAPMQVYYATAICSPGCETGQAIDQSSTTQIRSDCAPWRCLLHALCRCTSPLEVVGRIPAQSYTSRLLSPLILPMHIVPRRKHFTYFLSLSFNGAANAGDRKKNKRIETLEAAC